MRKLHDENNKILDTFVNSEKEPEVFGQVQGFSVTTFFLEDKNALLDKATINRAWGKLKTDKIYQYIRDNHKTYLPPIGCIKKAYLIENNDFLGIYIEVDITNKEVWEKFQRGEYKGFSGGFETKVMEDNINKDYNKVVELRIVKNSYTADQIQELESLFPDSDRVVVNQSLLFGAVPPEIIYVNIHLNVQYLIQLIQNNPVQSTLVTVGGMVLKSAIDVVVKDLYVFIKKGAKTLFSGKKIPKVVAKNRTMEKEIQIRLEADSPEKMKEAVESLNKVYSQLVEQNKSGMKDAQKIVFEQVNGKWKITLNFEKEKYKRLY